MNEKLRLDNLLFRHRASFDFLGVSCSYGIAYESYSVLPLRTLVSFNSLMFLLTYGSFVDVLYSWDLIKPKIMLRKCEIFLSAHLYFFDTQEVGNENKVKKR